MALVAPVIIPFNDLDPWSLLCLSFNPFSDLFVGGTGGDKILELVCRDFSETEKEVIQWTIEVVFARSPSQCCPALVEGAGNNNITGKRFTRATREIFCKIFGQRSLLRVYIH